MSYKQKSNPFKGPANFRNPKNKGTSNFNALQFQMPDLSQIINKAADGDSKTVDVTNESQTGSSDEGKVSKDTEVKSSTAQTVENANETKSIKELADQNRTTSNATYRDKVQADKEKRREFNEAVREARRMKKDRGNILTNEQRKEASDAFSSLKNKRKFDRGARKDNISVEQALINEAEAQKAAKAEEEKQRLEKIESNNTADYFMNKFNPEEKEGSGLFTKRGEQPLMKTKNMRQVKTKGKGFPMVNQPQQTDEMGNPMPQPNTKGTMAMGGRPLNSNMLTNDPNNNLDPSKVSAQGENKAQQFNAIASSAGTPTPQYNPYNNEMTGPSFNAKLRAASAAGDLDDNPNFKAAVDNAPAMVNVHSPSMHSMDHAHTKVTKRNLKATEKDDAAHMDYLKRDVNYDAKHGGSKKQMLDDEKHISKLAGDLKYDVKHHGRKYDNV